jgi:GT2 family glycosyltransferase
MTSGCALPRPQVSVIVPHYDDLANLDRCLDLLAGQSLPADDYEVIVADNGSPCGAGRVAEIIAGRARLVSAPEKGAGPARNAGVSFAAADIFAFIDSDCRPGRDWLAQGLHALERDDLAGGAVEVEIAGPEPTPSEAFELVFAFRNDVYVLRKGFSVTANLFVPRDVFERVGPFRNGLSEDLEWCHRAGAHGFSLGYAEDAVIAHPARRDWAELRRKWSRLSQESFALARRRSFGALLWLGRSYLVLASALPDLLTVARARQLRGLRSRAGAAIMLLRVRAFRFVEAHRLCLRHALRPRAQLPLHPSHSG